MPDVEAVTRAECAAGTRNAEAKPKGVRGASVSRRCAGGLAACGGFLHTSCRIFQRATDHSLSQQHLKHRRAPSPPWCSATPFGQTRERSKARRQPHSCHFPLCSTDRRLTTAEGSNSHVRCSPSARRRHRHRRRPPPPRPPPPYARRRARALRPLALLGPILLSWAFPVSPLVLSCPPSPIPPHSPLTQSTSASVSVSAIISVYPQRISADQYTESVWDAMPHPRKFFLKHRGASTRAQHAGCCGALSRSLLVPCKCERHSAVRWLWSRVLFTALHASLGHSSAPNQQQRTLLLIAAPHSSTDP